MESQTLARQAGQLSSAASSLRGQAVNVHAGPSSSQALAPSAPSARRGSAVCRASAEGPSGSATRRAVLGAGCASLALALAKGEALAAYGEAANVFGATKGRTDFYPYAGAGFKLDVPAKWNPSKELGEFANMQVRFEDNFDATNNLCVIAEPTSLSSIKDLGPSPLDFMDKYKFLLGVQSFDKETASEGGFIKNATVTAAILDTGIEEREGKTYYKVSLLSRTADGDEGGKHQLFTAAVSNGKLYILKVQAGDKRWFKGAKKFVEGAEASFTVA